MLVHSAYDLLVGLEAQRSAAAISGAILRATNADTGISYDARTAVTIHAVNGAGTVGEFGLLPR